MIQRKDRDMTDLGMMEKGNDVFHLMIGFQLMNTTEKLIQKLRRMNLRAFLKDIKVLQRKQKTLLNSMKKTVEMSLIFYNQ